jgi:site-specific recombinase XerD
MRIAPSLFIQSGPILIKADRPDLISEDELGQYFLYMKNVKKYSRVATTIALCTVKFFFEYTLNRPWTTLNLVRPPREKKLPTVLSVEEVRNILSLIRLPR